MADLSTNFAGIRCPNPFWLASAPPTNCGEQIMRAFDAGWGGAVWKTIGEPITNVSSRYSSIDWNSQRMMGLNNIELISDRPIEVNLREITSLRVGDVFELPASIFHETQVLLNGTPKFVGTVGLDTTKVAVQLTRKLPTANGAPPKSDGRKNS